MKIRGKILREREGREGKKEMRGKEERFNEEERYCERVGDSWLKRGELSIFLIWVSCLPGKVNNGLVM